MEPNAADLLERTVQPRYANRERKLARNVFMQATWVLLALTAVAQLLLMLSLDLF